MTSTKSSRRHSPTHEHGSGGSSSTASSTKNRMKPSPEMNQRMSALLKQPANQVCADCPARRPLWASFLSSDLSRGGGPKRLAVLVCSNCAQHHHFELGNKRCFLKYLKMAHEWTLHDVELLETTGNDAINTVFEAHLTDRDFDKGLVLNNEEDEDQRRSKFVKYKYKKHKYIDSILFHELVLRLINPAESEDVAKEEACQRESNEIKQDHHPNQHHKPSPSSRSRNNSKGRNTRKSQRTHNLHNSCPTLHLSEEEDDTDLLDHPTDGPHSKPSPPPKRELIRRRSRRHQKSSNHDSCPSLNYKEGDEPEQSEKSEKDSSTPPPRKELIRRNSRQKSLIISRTGSHSNLRLQGHHPEGSNRKHGGQEASRMTREMQIKQRMAKSRNMRSLHDSCPNMFYTEEEEEEEEMPAKKQQDSPHKQQDKRSALRRNRSTNSLVQVATPGEESNADPGLSQTSKRTTNRRLPKRSASNPNLLVAQGNVSPQTSQPSKATPRSMPPSRSSSKKNLLSKTNSSSQLNRTSSPNLVGGTSSSTRSHATAAPVTATDHPSSNASTKNADWGIPAKHKNKLQGLADDFIRTTIVTALQQQQQQQEQDPPQSQPSVKKATNINNNNNNNNIQGTLQRTGSGILRQLPLSTRKVTVKNISGMDDGTETTAEWDDSTEFTIRPVQSTGALMRNRTGTGSISSSTNNNNTTTTGSMKNRKLSTSGLASLRASLMESKNATSARSKGGKPKSALRKLPVLY